MSFQNPFGISGLLDFYFRVLFVVDFFIFFNVFFKLVHDCLSDGPISWVGKSFFQLQRIHVAHVRETWTPKITCFAFYSSEKRTLTAVSGIAVTRKSKGNNTMTSKSFLPSSKVWLSSNTLGVTWRQLDNLCTTFFSAFKLFFFFFVIFGGFESIYCRKIVWLSGSFEETVRVIQDVSSLGRRL